MTGKSEQGFMKDKLRLTNLIAFYNTFTGLVDVWQVVDIVYSIPMIPVCYCSKETQRDAGLQQDGITSTDKSSLYPYLALVRPHPECCAVLVPTVQKDVDRLQRIQRRTTKRTRGLGGLSCEERL